jgi:hypothetical protein
MGWTIGVLGFDSRRGLGIFLFTTASRSALGPTQPPIQWVVEPLSAGIKRPGREADHSPQSSAEIEEWVELYLHFPFTPSWRGAQLSYRDNFTFYLGWLTFLNSFKPVHNSLILLFSLFVSSSLIFYFIYSFFFPESFNSFTSYSLHIISICLAWSLQSFKFLPLPSIR